MKTIYLSICAALFFFGNMSAQWIDLAEETDTRITITNVNDNSDPNAVDDMEKDLAIGDFDQDGFIDLVVVRKAPFSTIGAKTDLLLMNRNGVLEDQTDLYAPDFLSDPTDSRDVIPVDVNNDTWLDLFIVNTFSDQPKLFINQGNDTNGDWLGFEDESNTRLPVLTLGIIQFCAGWGGDVTGNGAADLYMVNYDSSGLALDVLFINDGNGNFTDETETRMGELRNSSFGTGVEIHDIDNDGDLDIIKNLGLNNIPPFNDKGTIALFNNGDGTFTNWYKLPGAATYMFTAGDLDNDGMLEFYEVDDFADYVNSITGFVVDESLTISQYLLPTDRTDNWGGNVKMIDLDNDGDLDAALSSVDTDEPPCLTGEDRRFMIFENEGIHSGDLIHPYGSTINDWNVSTYDHDFIDINNDGYLDIILGTCDGYQIFMHQPVLSVQDQNKAISIAVTPNPNNGQMRIHLGNLQSDSLKLNLFTVNGRLIHSTSGEPTLLSSVYDIELDLSGTLKSGIYFLKITTDTGTITEKVVVK